MGLNFFLFTLWFSVYLGWNPPWFRKITIALFTSHEFWKVKEYASLGETSLHANIPLNNNVI